MPSIWRKALLAMLLSIGASSAAAIPNCSYTVLDVPVALEELDFTSDWQPYHSNGGFGYLEKPLWVRCQVGPHVGFFTVQNPVQKRFKVHFTDAQLKPIMHIPSGRVRAQNDHAIRGPEFNYSIPENAAWVLIQDNTQGPKNYPLTFQSAPELAERHAAIATIHGLYYGVIGIFTLYGFLAALITRQAVYSYYSLYALSLMAFLANKDGFGRTYLWSSWTDFLEYWPIISLAATVVAFCQFSIRFLETPKHYPRATRWLNVAQALFIAVVVARLITDHYITLLLEPYMVIAVVSLLLAIGVKHAISGSVAGRIFVLGNCFMAAGTATYALYIVGAAPSSLWVTHAVHLGSFLEVVIFSTTLGVVARQARRRNLEIQHQSLELSRRVKQLQSASLLAEEHRQLQRSLHNAQKQRTLGQMAGGISHEFNNILASILGFTELSQQRLDDKVQLTRYLEEIRYAGQRASNLVQQLVLYSRGNPQRLREVDLVDTVSEASNLLRSSLPPSLTINLNVDERNPPVRRAFMDPQNLQQLLVNVCLNASEAMDQRGIIDITLRAGHAQDILCASCMERFSGDYTVLEVIDNGPGISGSANEKFQPFHTTKSVGSGSGLGLSVVHGIVHESGGHVQLGNRAQGGLRVAMYLRDAPKQNHQPSAARILLIEDNPSVASYLSTLLDGEQYDVTTTGRATEALEQFMAAPAGFDLVITDNTLPHGSGVELAQDIMALRPDLPVVVLSTSVDELLESRAEEHGIKAVFSKPIESELFLARVRAILNTAQKAQESGS